MAIIQSPTAGSVCWPELCTDDGDGAKKFYAALFGWEAQDLHMPDGDYTILKLDGINTAALYVMKEERKKAGITPHWNSYVAVTDAKATAEKAAVLGGKVLTPPFEAGGDIMANLEDPTGAKFCIWQIGKQSEPIRLHEVGALNWIELYTRDGVKASLFYVGLFGWRPQQWEGGPMPYTVFNLPSEDNPIGGMITMPEEMPGQAQWIPYFMVDNCDEAAQRAEGAEGIITNPPMDIPGVGRMAMIADPQGAEFAIIKMG